MKTSSAEPKRIIELPDNRSVNVDSLGYIAYWRNGKFVGVCEPFTGLETVPCELGTEALNLIKQLVEHEWPLQQAQV